MSTRCRSCSAEIEWAKTLGGKWMPVDPEPIPGGNLALDRASWPYKVRVMEKGEGSKQLSFDDASEGETLGFVSHFVSCPDRRQWRSA